MTILKNKKTRKKVLWGVAFLPLLIFFIWQIVYSNHYKNTVIDGVYRQFDFEYGNELDDDLGQVIEKNFMETVSHVSYFYRKQYDLQLSSKYVRYKDTLPIKFAHPFEILLSYEDFENRLWTKAKNVEYLDVLRVVPIAKKDKYGSKSSYVLTVDKKDLIKINQNKKRILAGEMIVRPKNFEAINTRDLGDSSFYTYQENPGKQESKYTFLNVEKKEKNGVEMAFRYTAYDGALFTRNIISEKKKFSLIERNDERLFNKFFTEYDKNIYDWVLNYGQTHDLYGRKEINKIAHEILQARKENDQGSSYWQYYKNENFQEDNIKPVDLIKIKFFGKMQENFIVQSKDLQTIEISENVIKNKINPSETSARGTEISIIKVMNGQTVPPIDLNIDEVLGKIPELADYRLKDYSELSLIKINQQDYLKIKLYDERLNDFPYIDNEIVVYLDLNTQEIKFSEELGTDTVDIKRDDSKPFTYHKLLWVTNLEKNYFLNGIEFEEIKDQGLVVEINKKYFNELGESKLAMRYPEIVKELNQTKETSLKMFLKSETIETIIPQLIHGKKSIYDDLILDGQYSKDDMEHEIHSQKDFEKFYKVEEKIRRKDELNFKSREYQEISTEIEKVLKHYMDQVYLQQIEKTGKVKVSNDLKKIKKEKQKELKEELKNKLKYFDIEEKAIDKFVKEYQLKNAQISTLEIIDIRSSKVEASVKLKLTTVSMKSLFEAIVPEYLEYKKKIPDDIDQYDLYQRLLDGDEIIKLLSQHLQDTDNTETVEIGVILVKKEEDWFIRNTF